MSDAADRELTTPWEPTPEGLAAARRYVGKRLRHERKKAGMNQREAAEVAGISQTLYARIELGVAILDWKPLYLLAKHYGVKGSEMMPPDNYPAAPQEPAARLAWMRIRNRNIRNLGKTDSEEEA